MTTTHIIVGTGEDSEVTESVINTSLKDTLHTGDTVVIPWAGSRKPSPAMEVVYGYVIDHEVPFLMIHDGASKIPDVFMSSKVGTVQHVDNMGKAYAKEFDLSPDNLDGAALVLGEDETTETWLIDTFTSNNNIKFTDLARGGIPVDITAEPEEEAPVAEAPVAEEPVVVDLNDEDPTDDSEDLLPEEKVDIYSFSRQELEAMPARILKNIAEKTWGVGAEVPTDVRDIIEAAQESHPDAQAETDTHSMAITEAYKVLRALLEDTVNSRQNSIALTNLEQSALWYHYGADATGGK